ncbi:hypothetical protein [Otariodibacter oris]|uniref:Uncharacterized protein n=1 Tax=Otariodibacter oris TaxID=1032623 RepID=A0A420XJE6_9PAST|nr:hypothetical protein [Otariodibacter oris]QGM80423.1 hypothetical protein A6A10_02930 [Otariodibacter oris]RKR77432.1 hypothetical protein DES31_0762 [Otariodibacter oris]
MQKTLKKLYTSPTKKKYKIINIINKKRIQMILIIMLITITLSATNYFRLKNMLNKELEIQESYQEKLKNKSIILSKAYKKNQEKSKKTGSISIIDSKIKEIIIKNGGKLNNLQWYFGDSQKINVISTQNSKKSINIIQDINKIKHLKFTELILSKTGINKSIELDITLTIIP